MDLAIGWFGNRDRKEKVDEDISSKYPKDGRYSLYIARNPCISFFLALSFMLFIALLGPAITFTVKQFEVSNGGFEARGTDLSGLYISYNHIMREECKGSLSLKPNAQSGYYKQEIQDAGDDDPSYPEYSTCSSDFVNSRRQLFYDNHDYNIDIDHEIELKKHRVDDIIITNSNSNGNSITTHSNRQLASTLLVTSANAWQVASDAKDDVSLIFTGADLFTTEALKGMCDVDLTIQNINGWDINQPTDDNNGQSYLRPSRSIGNYVAQISGKSTCADITDADVAAVKTYLLNCRTFYDDFSLTGNCWDWNSNTYTTQYQSSIDKVCTLTSSNQYCSNYNAYYDIFVALTPSGWLSNGDEPLTVAQTVMASHGNDETVYLDAWKDTIEGMIGNTYQTATFETMDLSIKDDLFFENMYNDMYMMIPILILFIYAMLVIHSSSHFIAGMGLLQITFAFFWAFTFYEVILWRSFFPFLNFISIFLVLGVGADDLFVMIDAWKQSFTLLPGSTPFSSRISWTLRRAGSAMLVTSVTTSVSLIANTISPVTSIKCFGIFAGMVVVADFFLMLAFIPAVIAIHYTYFSDAASHLQMQKGLIGCGVCNANCFACQDEDQDGNVHYFYKDDDENINLALESCCCRSCCCCVVKNMCDLCAIPARIDYKEKSLSIKSNGSIKSTGDSINEHEHEAAPERHAEKFFRKYFSPITLHWLFKFFLLALTIGVGTFLATKAIGLDRPQNSYMQLLDDSHPLEIYEKTYQDKFDIGDGKNGFFYYSFVFGIDPVDNGDYFDPKDRGTPVYQSIDVSNADTQQFLYNLCDNVAQSPFTSSTALSTSDGRQCNMHYFRLWMERSCASTSDSDQNDRFAYPQRTSCCDYTAFPYSASDFNTCIQSWSTAMQTTGDWNNGVWYDSNGNIKVWVIHGEATTRYTEVYDSVKTWYSTGKNFLSDQYNIYKTAVPSATLPSGFFTTELYFYSLQKSITEGAMQAAGLSVLLAMIILLVMSRRLVAASSAAIQIAFVVLSVTGVIVMLGWRLGVIESLIFSVAVGLSCDFAAHLSHSFTSQEIDENLPKSFPCGWKDLWLHTQDVTRRATLAVTELGLTIFMGFLTTFVAGCLLLTSSTYFFYQFGIFLTSIMAFSLIFSFCFLMPMLSTIGWIDPLMAHAAKTTGEKIRNVYNERMSSSLSSKDIKNSNTGTEMVQA